MNLFGGILPFIGFKTLEVTPEMRRDLDLPPHLKEVDVFCVEWLNRGFAVFTEPE